MLELSPLLDVHFYLKYVSNFRRMPARLRAATLKPRPTRRTASAYCSPSLRKSERWPKCSKSSRYVQESYEKDKPGACKLARVFFFFFFNDSIYYFFADLNQIDPRKILFCSSDLVQNVFLILMYSIRIKDTSIAPKTGKRFNCSSYVKKFSYHDGYTMNIGLFYSHQ